MLQAPAKIHCCVATSAAPEGLVHRAPALGKLWRKSSQQKEAPLTQKLKHLEHTGLPTSAELGCANQCLLLGFGLWHISFLGSGVCQPGRAGYLSAINRLLEFEYWPASLLVR